MISDVIGPTGAFRSPAGVLGRERRAPLSESGSAAARSPSDYKAEVLLDIQFGRREEALGGRD